MIRGYVKWIFILGSFFISINVYANIDKLKELVEKNKAEEAYQLADKMLLENEGDPVFDYYYGLAAIDSGHPDKGVLALERILMFYPQQHRARLELGRALFMMGEYEKAKIEFETVLKNNPPAPVAEKITFFIDEISKKINQRSRVTNIYAGLDAGYDTNINGATTIEGVYLPGGTQFYTLSDESRETASTFAEIKAGARFNKRLSKVDAWFLNADFQNRSNSKTSDFDTNQISLGGGYSYLGSVNKFQFPLVLNALTMDGEESRYSFSASAIWSRSLDRSISFTGFTQIGSSNFPESSDRDVDNVMMGLSLTGDFKGITTGINALYAVDIPRGDALKHNGKGASSLGLNAQYSINKISSVWSNFSYLISKYDEDHVVFSKTREDEVLSLGIGYRRLVSRELSLSVQVSYTNNDSNLELYTYKRTQSKVGLKYQF